ncbi:hypothetical protein [Paenibacillus radicis (ex Gao et al. 2016)]|uniref:Uncharacterized protein n=1 Tax=Paenibacillus radicis (ex Gao et al. 2016) TaxID=1737354 RepID=A0A917H1D5_9BACL|nr:hypothetical protein [Paenibacillus radicis (ex Gao et al. 2016)]GGG64450.1 hypothetical protein GCM10010918_18150 [Paenibacillus radicis (ex Gao et al. 2016)]
MRNRFKMKDDRHLAERLKSEGHIPNSSRGCVSELNPNHACESTPHQSGDSESMPAAEGKTAVQPVESLGLESDLRDHIDMLKKS